MKVLLAIETTCDETSVALIEGNSIVKNFVYSQVSLHSLYRGVVPEVASRAHSEKIIPLVGKILKGVKKLDAVIFSRGPGLSGPLIIGSTVAKTLAEYFNVLCIGVNHLEGHLLSCEIREEKIEKKLKFPLIALIISGGHSELWLVSGYGRYRILGTTRDDAAGEAFDKVAKLIGLGYPGGPEIEKLAKRKKADSINFPVPEVKDSFDFSFSGLKTAVAYYIRDNKKLVSNQKAEIAYSFQKSVIESLFRKTLMAVMEYGVKQVAVCGGVAANGRLREYFIQNLSCITEIVFPEKIYCTDNAAMIGVCGLRRFEYGNFVNSCKIDPDLNIEAWR